LLAYSAKPFHAVSRRCLRGRRKFVFPASLGYRTNKLRTRTTHAKLSKLGAEAELHVIEAMGHASFAFSPRDPMSDDVHNAIVRFFDKHLGK
jgi:hypothetical protein